VDFEPLSPCKSEIEERGGKSTNKEEDVALLS